MLPPIHQINKDFLKKLLVDEKKLFKKKDINLITVPKLDEMGLKKMIAMVKDDDLIC